MNRPHDTAARNWQKTFALAPLPVSKKEMEARGWDYVDVVFVTGDAYVDHPSFAIALAMVLLVGFAVVVTRLRRSDTIDV